MSCPPAKARTGSTTGSTTTAAPCSPSPPGRGSRSRRRSMPCSPRGGPDMTSSSDLDDVARYAAAVRAALADLPAQERADLLEDLEDHLTEVASESDVPLTQRLGSPEQYAAEPRSAYGARTGELPRRYQVVLAALRRTATYRAVADFLPQL